MRYIQRFETLLYDAYEKEPTETDTLRRLTKWLVKGGQDDTIARKLVAAGWPDSVPKLLTQYRDLAEARARIEQVQGSGKAGKSYACDSESNEISEIKEQLKTLTKSCPRQIIMPQMHLPLVSLRHKTKHSKTKHHLCAISVTNQATSPGIVVAKFMRHHHLASVKDAVRRATQFVTVLPGHRLGHARVVSKKDIGHMIVVFLTPGPSPLIQRIRTRETEGTMCWCCRTCMWGYA